MLIVTLRTDKPEAELRLYDDAAQVAYETWHAHRELAETLHQKIQTVLESHGKQLSDLQGIVCFEGPGSFTGLRIGLTVANALAYSYHIPIVATHDDSHESWSDCGIRRLRAGESDAIALPVYGAPAIVTTPKK